MKRVLTMSMLVGTAFLFATSAQAFCIFSCLPSEDNAKSAFINVLKSQLHDQPFNVVTFEKSNGIENDVFGQKIYLLQFKATVVFPSGLNHRCKPRANGELQGLDALQDSLRFLQECSDQRYYYQRYYEAGAKQDFSDSYEFDKTERGWSGPDGKVY